MMGMARSASSIQAEIDAIESLLQSSASLVESVAADGASRTINRAELASRLDKLYQQLGRANGSDPMFVRGRIRGLRL
jgi:hypothetical protein